MCDMFYVVNLQLHRCFTQTLFFSLSLRHIIGILLLPYLSIFPYSLEQIEDLRTIRTNSLIFFLWFWRFFSPLIPDFLNSCKLNAIYYYYIIWWRVSLDSVFPSLQYMSVSVFFVCCAKSSFFSVYTPLKPLDCDNEQAKMKKSRHPSSYCNKKCKKNLV